MFLSPRAEMGEIFRGKGSGKRRDIMATRSKLCEREKDDLYRWGEREFEVSGESEVP